MSKLVQLFIPTCICITGASSFVYGAEGVSLSDVPAVVQEVVKREFAGARVTGIDDGEYEGISVYEIEAETADGREIELEVAKDRMLLEKEEEVGLTDVPAGVCATVKRELSKVLPQEGTIHCRVEAEVSGKDVEPEIGEDGTLLDKEVEDDE